MPRILTHPFRGGDRSLARDVRGVALISFAFVAPLLMMLTLGIVDFGRALWTHSTLAYAAREAARFASVNGAGADTPAMDADIAEAAVAASPGIGLAPGNVTVTWMPSNQPGGSVTVEIAINYEFLMGGFVPLSPIQLKSASTRTVF